MEAAEETGVSFRLASPPDLDLLLAFMHALSQVGDTPLNEPAARAALLELMREPAFGRVWLIWAGLEPVGYVVLTLGFSLEFHGRDAFIDELFVREDYRGRGIGTRALNLVEQTCLALGVKALHLEVEHENLAAQRLYRRHGFQDHARYLMTRWLG